MEDTKPESTRQDSRQVYQQDIVPGAIKQQHLVANPCRKGDIYYGTNGVNFGRLDAGSTGQAFTIADGVPAWSNSLENVVVTGEYNNGNSAAAITLDWSNGPSQYVLITANCTISYSNAVAGQRIVFRIVEDSTGSRTITLPTSKYSGGSTFTTTANAINLAVVYFDGVNYLTQIAPGFA